MPTICTLLHIAPWSYTYNSVMVKSLKSVATCVILLLKLPCELSAFFLVYKWEKRDIVRFDDLPKYFVFPTYRTLSCVYECVIFRTNNLNNLSSKFDYVFLPGTLNQGQELLLVVKLNCLYRIFFKNSTVFHIDLGNEIKTVVQLF